MNILIACEDFRVGGAQVFALRLAQVLSKEHQVWLYSHYWNLIDYKLTERIAPDVEVLFYKLPKPFDLIIKKLDRILYHAKIDFSIREKLVAKNLSKIINQLQCDVVHSHMFKSDYIIAKALTDSTVSIPIIITMHGNYEGFLQNYIENVGEVILNYPRKLKETLARINSIVYLTDKNLRIFQEAALVPKNCYRHIIKKKIYNGFSGSVDAPHRRSELGIADDTLVFGMVARGIPEKGWEVAIEAFKKIPKNTAHLILVGWGNYIADLVNKYKNQNNIHFVGYSDNPLDWITLFDIGLLPSVSGESLPNVIAEYLFLRKPVVCTDIGDSKNMIAYEDDFAGFVLNPQSSNLAEDLKMYLQKYLDQPELLQQHMKLAGKAFEKFQMEDCLASYTNLYQELLND